MKYILSTVVTSRQHTFVCFHPKIAAGEASLGLGERANLACLEGYVWVHLPKQYTGVD
jgi:hypothetical protein